MIFIVGNWFTYGPRANDCYFIVGFVSTDKQAAVDYFEKHARENWELKAAESGSEFHEWETLDSR